MFLLEHSKHSDYFILSIKVSEWRAYCFLTLLKMVPIGKGWAHLVGGLSLCTALTNCSISMYCHCVIIYYLCLAPVI